MIFDKILTNISTVDTSNLEVERIFVESEQLPKKILRVTSDKNNEYGISLKESEHALEDGAVLFIDDTKVIVIETKKDSCIIITPGTLDKMGEIAHYLGNMHRPILIKDGSIIIYFDSFIEGILQEKGISFSIEEYKLEKAMKHVEFGHKH